MSVSGNKWTNGLFQFKGVIGPAERLSLLAGGDIRFDIDTSAWCNARESKNNWSKVDCMPDTNCKLAASNQDLQTHYTVV